MPASPTARASTPSSSRCRSSGPVITVRKFSARPYTVEDLIGFGTATAEMFEFLRVCIEARLNVFVSGGTGSGKTTTLNVLSSFIPERRADHHHRGRRRAAAAPEHIVTLEARPPNLEGRGEITIRDLLRNALHMRPDRIIVGECRAGEALDMIQAMTTGQDGSLSTGHANSPPDMLRRLETMVLMTGYEMPLRAIREQIASAVDLIVHTARLRDGSRKVINITEVYGIEDDEILTQDIFTFEQTGVVDGKVEGTGADRHPPDVHAAIRASGIELPAGEFGIPPDDPKKPGRPHRQEPLRQRRLPLGSTPRTRRSAPAGRSSPAAWSTSRRSGRSTRTTGQLNRGGISEQTRQCLGNLTAALEAAGSSLDKVVWANWSLREPTDFETFNEEWTSGSRRGAGRPGHAHAPPIAVPDSASRSGSSPKATTGRRHRSSSARTPAGSDRDPGREPLVVTMVRPRRPGRAARSGSGASSAPPR